MRLIGDKLKASLLQDAFQGKLTKQLPEDGDARDLLKEIQAEKERLVKEKKIKEEKNLPVIKDEEIPFDLPKNWVWTRLGKIGYWSSGTTPNRTNFNYYNDGTYNWLKTGDLTDGNITSTSEKITEKALRETSVKLLPRGSVLIAMYGATIGKLGILEVESTTNQACCGCIPYNGILNYYLFYFLLFSRKKFIEMGAGCAQPNISKEKIINTVVPVPPLAEQRRIVDKLKTAIEKTDELKFFETKLSELEKSFPNKLKASLLQDAFQGKLTKQLPEDGDARDLLKEIKAEKKRLVEEKKIKEEKPFSVIKDEEVPFDIPKNWVWTRLGEVTNYGECRQVNKHNIGSHELIIELEDIEKNSYKILHRNFDRIPGSNKNRFKKNDVLYGKLRPYLRKCVIVDCDGYCSTEIIPINGYGRIDQKFIMYYMTSPFVDIRVNSLTHGMDMPRLGTRAALKLLFPLPPLVEQRRIVKIIEAAMQKIDCLDDR